MKINLHICKHAFCSNVLDTVIIKRVIIPNDSPLINQKNNPPELIAFGLLATIARLKKCQHKKSHQPELVAFKKTKTNLIYLFFNNTFGNGTIGTIYFQEIHATGIIFH